ncbi:tetratricopeptide repeat protein [Aliarcobacter lanthieri]|uniref:tetratricopeptide repeat protein n=1 Tax=Aliarcobacter lanthieri TaxID=1355374 RepID=UPI00047C83C9|nr:SEL1-like repeat protein [Aliarcobacter lanthieri]QKF60212.1 tetratricopeptide repeat protein [Aliarcobacter lanthieri]
MLKNIIISISTIFLLTACSFKMPEFLTFGSSINYEEELTEANLCQVMENESNKLYCYKNIENKNSFAKIRLGTYHADKKEYQEALKYLNEAKENKNLFANLPISFIYYKGEGVRKDINKSFELLKESSNIDPVAAFQLSRFYLQGINTKIDNEKGIELLNFAAQKGVFQAQEMLASIYKQGMFEQPKDQVKYEYWLNKVKSNKEDLNHKIYIF